METPTLNLPDLPPNSLVAVDTETSGLFVDDGARVSIVSIAWYDGGGTPGNPDFAGLATDPGHVPHSRAYAFDQGRVTPLGEKTNLPGAKGRGKNKPKAGQMGLFEDNLDAAPNLPPSDYYRLMEWLAGHSLVFHNAKFDLHILQQGLRGHGHTRHLLPDLSRSVAWDTQVCNPVLWPEHPTSLKPTSARLWGEEEKTLQKNLQTWLNNNGYRFDLAPWSLVGPYAAKDAEQTLRLYDIQQMVIDFGERGDPGEVRVVCERECDLAITLFRMESRGIGLRAHDMLEEAEKISQLIEDAEWELRKEIFEALSTEQTLNPQVYERVSQVPTVTEHLMRQVWFDSDRGLGLFPVTTTDKGTASVAQEVVRELVERETPFAQNYERLNALTTAHSMWYNSWPRLVGPPEPGWHPELVADPASTTQFDRRWPRLRTNYRQSRTHSEKGGTVSGRLAVERVQLQAIPQDYQIPEGLTPVRRYFAPDDGYVLWEVDLAQAEYRVAAGISECQKLIDGFLAGDDAHSATARLIFGVDENSPDWTEKRQLSKRLNFGMLYGAGAPTTRNQIKLHTGMDVPLETLQEWLDQYRRTFPELGRASRRVQRIVEKNRTLKLAGGRERWFSWFEQEHKAFNQLIQGGVAEMMKDAMIEIEATMPGVMLLQIHDSVIGESRIEEYKEQTGHVQGILVRTFEKAFNAPFKCDSKVWK